MFKKWFYGFVASLLVLTTLGAAVTPAFAKALNPNVVIVTKKTVKAQKGQSVIVSAGKGGVYMPLMPFDGNVEVSSLQLSSLPKPSTVLTWAGGLKWDVTRPNGLSAYYNGIGPTVFFNLKNGFEKRAMNDHKAVIYHWTGKGQWVALSTFAAKGGTRAAAYTQGLGIYALALTK
jgi:hypothetical protein